MKNMFLLICFVLSMISMSVMAAVDVPGKLSEDEGDATITGDFFGGTNGAGRSCEYYVNTTEAGSYMLYLNVGTKPSGENGLFLDIYVNETKIHEIREGINYGGNWGVYIMRPFPLELEAGAATIKLVSQGDRWNIRKNNHLLKKDTFYQLEGNLPLTIDPRLPDESSSLNFTSYAAWTDNARYGDDESVLVTAYEVTTPSKRWSPMEKTRLKYMLEVPEKGMYPVTLNGMFTFERTDDKGIFAIIGEEVDGFSIELKGTWDNGQEYFSETIDFDKVTQELTYFDVSKDIELEKGTYFLEISTPYAKSDGFYSLKSITINEAVSTELGADPVGKYKPVVNLNGPEGNSAYLNDVFIVTGTVILDQEDDVLSSAKIYMEGSELGDIVVAENGTFSFDVPAISTVGNYTFQVIVETERAYSAESEVITVSIAKRTYEFLIIDNTGGTIIIKEGSNYPVEEGDDITFEMIPNEGYEVDYVLIDDVNEGAFTEYTFTTVTEAHSIEAFFKVKKYTITATAGDGGIISPEGAVVVFYGDNQPFTITPNEGYEIEEIKIDGIAVTNTSTYTFESVVETHTIDVSFKLKEYTITATARDNGSISPSGDVTVSHGNDQSFTITPDEDYEIEEIKVDGVVISNASTYTFENVVGDHTIEVTFKKGTALDIQNNLSDNVFLFYNDGRLNISLPGQKIGKVMVFSPTGVLLANQLLGNGAGSIEVGNYSMLIVSMEIDGQIIVKKVIGK